MVASPQEVAARALGIELADILHVERIKHGLTNDSWRVQTAAGTAAGNVIVRISNAAEEALRIDRRSEARVLALVSEARLGPDVLLCDLQAHLLVTRDLGETWSDSDAHLPHNIANLAQQLRRLHALVVPDGVRRVDLGETVRGYLRVLDESGYRSDITALHRRTRAREAAAALRQHSAACLCHNDVHHLNVVGHSDLRLIDWEYSGIGEPMFDLASVCIYHRYDDAERNRLLHSYLSQNESHATHRLDLACWLFEYVRELWMEVRSLT